MSDLHSWRNEQVIVPIENEAYMTPRWVIRRLLDVWTPPVGVACEPAVGEGAITQSLYDMSPKKITAWLTCDIRSVSIPGMGNHIPVFHRQADYLTTKLEAPERVFQSSDYSMAQASPDVSLVITNPPFSLADQFILKSRRDFPKAELVFLLRLGFLASKERMPLWEELGEPDLLILPNRPSYTTRKPGVLQTDKYDYGWYIWPSGRKSMGHLSHLALTSLEERKLG